MEYSFSSYYTISCIPSPKVRKNHFSLAVTQDNDKPVLPEKDLNPIPVLENKIQVATRSFNTYTNILGGDV